ncbi:MAG: tRNA glutamyl-Q(34) synthetase GluQRS [Gammaproteobacteria bacterium]|nr:tRNA glutamyl-Q(34) synthetase GluQRS [Gammaproteobacteria bacterium]
MPNTNPQIYKGRFAPSPTGPVHYGTLIAAVGSYLQAKSNDGQWLIRMEDVDITRKVDGADVDILNTLESFGFEWDGAVIYQSEQTEHYEQAVDELLSQSLVFPCFCTRKQLAKSDDKIYPGTCRQHQLPEKHEHALRLLAKEISIEFNDAVMGKQRQEIKQQCGDFIIKRRDGLFAYQLAVVVDDAMQNITEVVRGADLLDSTPRQIYLQQLLNYPTPDYCHLPLAVDNSGNKISKSEGATKIDLRHKEQLLVSVLDFLGQNPPEDLLQSSINDIWSWATEYWDVTNTSSNCHIKAVLDQKYHLPPIIN